MSSINRFRCICSFVSARGLQNRFGFLARRDNSPIFAFDGQIYNVSDIDKLPVKHFVDDQLDVEIHETNTDTFIIDGVMFEYFVKVAVDKSQLTTGYQFTRLLNRLIDLLFQSYYH